MGRVAMDWEWESYNKLIDAGWIRKANEVKDDDGNVTIVLKSNTLESVVNIIELDLDVFIRDVRRHIDGVRQYIGDERMYAVYGKGEVYKYVKKKEKLTDIVEHNALIVEKYIP